MYLHPCDGTALLYCFVRSVARPTDSRMECDEDVKNLLDDVHD